MNGANPQDDDAHTANATGVPQPTFFLNLKEEPPSTSIDCGQAYRRRGEFARHFYFARLALPARRDAERFGDATVRNCTPFSTGGKK